MDKPNKPNEVQTDELDHILWSITRVGCGIDDYGADDMDEQTLTVQSAKQQILKSYIPLKEVEEAIGRVDNSPMYFAELYEGQARDASNIRKGRNEFVTELRQKLKLLRKEGE